MSARDIADIEKRQYQVVRLRARMPNLTVRPMHIDDVPLIVDYWVNAAPEDLARMVSAVVKFLDENRTECERLKAFP